MSRRSVRRLGTVALVSVAMLAASAPSIGRAIQPQPGPQATHHDPEALKVISRARSAYLALKSYREAAKGSYVWKPAGMREQSTQWDVSTSFVTPTSLVVAINQEMMISDGVNLFKVANASKQYTKEPLPTPFDPQLHTEGLSSSNFFPTPTSSVLARGEANPELLLRSIRKLTGVSVEQRDGVAGKLVCAKGAADPSNPSSPEVEIQIFFRDTDGLITEIHYDYTKANNAEDETDWESVIMSYKMRGIEVDPDLPTTSFDPPAGFALVDVLGVEQPIARADQTSLIGKPAPEFAGDGLDGKPVRLADYRGRVVILDFWATWCPPCVAAIPHIQELSERFEDKPVTVLGINQNRGDTEKVAEFVAEKKVTFRHLMDDGGVGDSYLVTGIPCTVLIDPKGVVQDIVTGFGPEQEEQLASKVEVLLNGKALRTDEELARLREQVEAKKSRPALAFTATDPEKLTLSAFKARAFYSRHMSWGASIEGDMATELITPGQDNSVEIIDSAGESIRTLRFKGLPRRGRVVSVAPVRVNGARHWLVGYTTLERDAGDSTLIGLYDDAGAEIWRFKPDLPQNSFVQPCVAAGDMTGDQVPEMVVGLSATRSGGSRGLEFGAGNQAGAIIVLSADGTVLSQKATAQVDLVFVGQPKEPGKPGRLLVSIAGRLQAVTLNLEASAPAGP